MTSVPAKVVRRAERRARLEAARLRHALGERVSRADALRRAVPNGDVAAAAVAFRAGEGARFFFDRADRREIVAVVERARRGWCDDAIIAGQRILGGELNLFGRVVHYDPSAPPWHEDTLSGYRWSPRTFHRSVGIPYGKADVKLPWELSRCQHLPALGIAYIASGDELFAAGVASQIEQWLDANPSGRGVNWVSPMEVAIRAVNWLWAFELIADAECITEPFVELLLSGFLAHGRYVAANVERYGTVTTNHTLADFVGLLYLGMLVPQVADAAGWRELGIRGVVECMEQQVLPDGVDYENSIPYHRFVLEMLLGCWILAKRNDRPLPTAFAASLQRMMDFVAGYTRPDGLAPLIGDNDDGRLQILGRYFGWQPQDHRHLLAAGGVLFDRDDLCVVARSAPDAPAEVSWLLGPSAWSRIERAVDAGPEPGSVAFPYGGRHVLRTRDAYVIICTDEVGTGGLGNHKHNDILGFELAVDGVSLLVDPGVGTYTSDRADRDAWRSTRSHNTLTVDNVEQNEMDGWFSMKPRARVALVRFDSGTDVDVLEAEHSGFSSAGVTHRRRFELRRDSFSLAVSDTLTGTGHHTARSYLHFAAGTALRSLDGGGYVLEREGVEVEIHPHGDATGRVTAGRVAPRYRAWVEAPVLELELTFSGRAETGYTILRRARA